MEAKYMEPIHLKICPKKTANSNTENSEDIYSIYQALAQINVSW